MTVRNERSKDNIRLRIPPSECILVSEEQAAALLGISLVAFRSWVADGLLSRVELPNGMKRNLYRRADLERFAADLAAAAARL